MAVTRKRITTLDRRGLGFLTSDLIGNRPGVVRSAPDQSAIWSAAQAKQNAILQEAFATKQQKQVARDAEALRKAQVELSKQHAQAQSAQAALLEARAVAEKEEILKQQRARAEELKAADAELKKTIEAAKSQLTAPADYVYTASGGGGGYEEPTQEEIAAEEIAASIAARAAERQQATAQPATKTNLLPLLISVAVLLMGFMG